MHLSFDDQVMHFAHEIVALQKGSAVCNAPVGTTRQMHLIASRRSMESAYLHVNRATEVVSSVVLGP
jgi:hypothetical protein